MTSAAWDCGEALTEHTELLKRAATTEEGDVMAANNHFKSPILRVPGEIRNQIYKFVCSSTTVRYGKAYEKGFGGSATACRFTQTFLLVCKQFHSEAIMLIYALATFEVCSYTQWLSYQSFNPKYCSFITSLSVNSQVVSTAIRMTLGYTHIHYADELVPNYRPGTYFAAVERVHIHSPDWLHEYIRDVLRFWFENEDLQVTGNEVRD